MFEKKWRTETQNLATDFFLIEANMPPTHSLAYTLCSYKYDYKNENEQKKTKKKRKRNLFIEAAIAANEPYNVYDRLFLNTILGSQCRGKQQSNRQQTFSEAQNKQTTIQQAF